MKRIAEPVKRSCAAFLSLCLVALSFGTPRLSTAQVVVNNGGGANAGSLGVAGAAMQPDAVATELGGTQAGLDLQLGGTLKAGPTPTLTPSAGLSAGSVVSPTSGIRIIPASQPLAVVSAAAMGRVDPARARASVVPLAAGDDRPSGPTPATAGSGNAPAAAAAQLNLASNVQTAPVAFDGGAVAGILPGIKPADPDLRLDEKPALPAETEVPRVYFDLFQRAARRNWLSRLFSWSSGPAEAIELPGNPQTEDAIETALVAVVRAQPGLFGNIRAEDLKTKLRVKVPGQAGLEDMAYVNFRQQKDSLIVDGTYLNFQVKLGGGKAVVIASRAQLYPSLSVDTQGALDLYQAKAKALERLNIPAGEDVELVSEARKIMHLGGKWRTVQVFAVPKKIVMVAVDVNSGEAFVWDPRVTMETASSPASADGIKGRGVQDGPQKPDATLTELPLGHIKVTASDGKVYYADKDGYFAVEGRGETPVELTIALEGRYAIVRNQQGRDLVVKASAKPGERVRVVFNPEGAEEFAVADVNAYYFTTLTHDWTVARGIKVEGIDKPITIHTNIDDECNAYYTGWTLNFFKASERCVNSAYSDVNPHEYWHGVDDLITGIINGALSEGWGDIAAMFITGQPVVGRGFLKGQAKDYIRHGENTYQYRAHDEVHAQGQAWMGFAWKLKKALEVSLGDPGRAQALAEALILPAIFAGARDIPSAIQQVLLRDVDAGGNAPHLKEIQAAAAAHGIKVKLPKAGEQDNEDPPALLSRVASWAADSGFVPPEALRAKRSLEPDDRVTAVVAIQASRRSREALQAEVERLSRGYGVAAELRNDASGFSVTLKGRYGSVHQVLAMLHVTAGTAMPEIAPEAAAPQGGGTI